MKTKTAIQTQDNLSIFFTPRNRICLGSSKGAVVGIVKLPYLVYPFLAGKEVVLAPVFIVGLFRTLRAFDLESGN